MTPLGAAVRGLAAAAVGTAAMDAGEYAAYRSRGGRSRPLEWEFRGVNNWDQAAAPGKVGHRLLDCWTQEEIPSEWAGLVNNVVHWGFGISWGLAYGLIAGSISRHPPVILGLPYGVGVWLFGYIVLPLGHFYKPIWDYDASTLGKDLLSHLVYGSVTGLTFRFMAD
ncbi:MAG: hypothetical protein ACRDFS_02970 [Chloroflexota bacterium]